VSKTEVMVTIIVDGAPVAKVVAGFATLVDLGVAMQAIERALRPEAASWSGWSCSCSRRMLQLRHDRERHGAAP
jgi:hypothetical protein